MGSSLFIIWTWLFCWFHQKTHLPQVPAYLGSNAATQVVFVPMDRIEIIHHRLLAATLLDERAWNQAQVQMNHHTLESLLTHGRLILSCMKEDRAVMYGPGQPHEWVSPTKRQLWASRFSSDELGYRVDQAEVLVLVESLTHSLRQAFSSNQSGKKVHYLRMLEPLLEDLEQMHVLWSN